VPTLDRPRPTSLWNQRADSISGRCHFVLERQGISQKDIRSFVQAMAKWFWSEKVTPSVSNGSVDFSLPYTRPVSRTIWDERFDLTTSIANQPVTKQFLKMIGSRKELPDHRFYGYVAALTLVEIMEGLMGTRLEELGTFENFGGPHEEGGPDWTAFELAEETNSMIESMLGKAEEFVFKADAFEEAARKGAEGSHPVDDRWEPPVLAYLARHREIVEAEFRKPSGKINRNGLARRIVSELQAKGEVKLPKSDRTIANRLKLLLSKAGILEMRD
jgi:hypothetical protein